MAETQAAIREISAGATDMTSTEQHCWLARDEALGAIHVEEKPLPEKNGRLKQDWLADFSDVAAKAAATKSQYIVSSSLPGWMRRLALMRA